MSTQVSEVDYADATENYLGYCTECCEFTTSECEPDAEDYTCDSCEGNTVVGAENALIMGLIEIVPEGEEVE
jgi:hypothetical protein